MGKARRKGKKGRGRRGDRVTGNLSMRDAVAVAAAQSNEESLLAQLTSIDANEREIAVASLSTLLAKGGLRTARAVADGGGIPSLSTVLLDTVPSVQATAAGAIRNLVLAADVDLLERLVREDTMTPLLVVVARAVVAINRLESEGGGANGGGVGTSAGGGSNTETGQRRRDLVTMLTQSLVAMGKLCAVSSEATAAFSASGALEQVVHTLSVDLFEEEVVVAAAEVLHIATDGNPELAAKLIDSGVVNFLIGALEASTGGDDQGDQLPLQVAVLFGSILLNVRTAETNADVIRLIAPVLLSSLEPNAAAMLDELGPDNMTTDGPDEAEARGQWREVADTQQIALECFANMCVPFGAEDWAEAAADGDPNDGGYLEDDGAGGDGPGVALPPEIVEALQPIPLLGLVTARMELLSDGIHQLAQGADDAMRLVVKSYTVFTRYVSLYGNLVFCIPLEDVPGDSWDRLFALALAAAPISELLAREAAADPMEAVVSAMLSLVRRAEMAGAGVEASSDQAETMLRLAADAPSAEVRTNALGVVAHLLQHEQHAAVLLNPAAEVMADKLEDRSLSVNLAALDAIFTIYAEPEANGAVAAVGMMGALEQMVPRLRAAIKDGRRTLDREMLGRLDEARVNLVRFIEYKRDQPFP